MDSGVAGSPRDAGEHYYLEVRPTGPQGIDPASGDAKTVDIRMHGESLLLDSTDVASATLRFDILAAADDKYGNGDGAITLTELGLVPLADIGLRGRYMQHGGDIPAPSTRASLAWTTLEDFVYLGLYPKVARFENDGTCAEMTR